LQLYGNNSDHEYPAKISASMATDDQWGDQQRLVVDRLSRTHEIFEAVSLIHYTQLPFALLAFVLILASYLVSSQVFQITLRSLDQRMDWRQTWATAIVAITMSQAVPGGAVGSYAFLANTFHRRGVSAGGAAVIASLETLSYAGAMLIFFGFGLLYLLAEGLKLQGEATLAAIVGMASLTSIAIIATRPCHQLSRWFNQRGQQVARWQRRASWRQRLRRLCAELLTARAMLLSQPRTIITLIAVQLVALTGHSLALLVILASLGAPVSLAITMAAFAVALVTSTFNVLPGGGGTVEAALIAVLLHSGVGAAAVPAAIIFRLLNFWLIAPIALAAYTWLSNE
jgi:uncharacterized protein (TIRG00374 family)